jgi:hypothetical protein
MVLPCKICCRLFYSPQTLKRHMLSIHPLNHDDDMASITESEATTTLPASEVDSEPPSDKEDSGSDESDEESSKETTESEVMDEDQESTVSESSEHTGSEIWSEIIQYVMDNSKDELLAADGTIKMSKLLKEVRNVTEWHVVTSRNIHGTDVYQKIRKTAKRLENQDYEDDEAINVAWKMRKYLVRKEIIEPNAHLIEQDTEDEIDGEE